MRESNFAFPAQNRACVCISAQLYDRRALDTTSPLPLFNSLTHLTYLTSTSPRIREIMTMDGGLERLVRILHDFCMCPPPPENPSILYGLSPPNARPPKLVPTLNPSSFDKHAAYRFSLAFQCVVNIGVRGSEDIRGRVVQAGTLDVVGCILEAWLANKGFALGPSTSATGMPRETREQRLARRLAQQDQRQREEAAEITRALERQITADNVVHSNTYIEDDERMSEVSSTDTRVSTTDLGFISEASLSHTPPIPYTRSSATSANDTDADTSTDTSTNDTPVRSGTPTGTVLVPGRERSGTVVARPVWDEPNLNATGSRHRIHHRARGTFQSSPADSTDTSQPNTETEDDGDVDMDRDRDDEDSPERHNTHSQRTRRAVGIVSDAPPAAPLDNTEVHIIINDARGGVVGGDGVGVEDGIVSLEPNDDFAMGAPPGAPGAINDGAGGLRRDGTLTERRNRAVPPDVTPRAGPMDLPMTAIPTPAGRTRRVTQDTVNQTPTNMRRTRTGDGNGTNATATPVGRSGSSHNHHSHHRDTDSGPYRDEDVLLSLQLLAYLSKYPHVRQAFYKSRSSFHPASVGVPNTPRANATAALNASSSRPKEHGFFRAFGSSRGKEKANTTASAVAARMAPNSTRQTNVFSLVERFTFRPSSTETDLPNPPPKLPPEIQYWAGVIMRNACRKDESRGGIRQCANMLCGRWETYPREFAKCRRCRKAKYCGKECQSTAWSEGHRFWCSAKEGDDEATETHAAEAGGSEVEVEGEGPTGIVAAHGGTVTGRAERRADRERERHARERAVTANASGAQVAHAARVAAFRNGRDDANISTVRPIPAPPTATRIPGTPGANRPLLAAPEEHWRAHAAARTPLGVDLGSPAAASWTASTQQLAASRRRAETAVNLNDPGRRFIPEQSDLSAGPSRVAYLQEDQDMTVD